MQTLLSPFHWWGYWRQRANERFGDPPPRWSQEPSVVWSETGIEDPQEDSLAVHCFCVCSGSVLLGDLLGVSRSRERDLPSVVSICPRIFLCVFIVYRRVVSILCLLLYSAMLMCVGCFGLVVSICQVIGYRKTLWGHLNVVRLPP